MIRIREGLLVLSWIVLVVGLIPGAFVPAEAGLADNTLTFRIDQLTNYTEIVPGFPDASFQYIPYVNLPGNISDFFVRTFKGHSRTSRYDKKVFNI